MDRILATLGLLASLLVSGCAGTDPDAAVADDPRPAPAGQQPLAAEPAVVTATRTVATTPLHVEGSTPLGGCVGASGVFGTCSYPVGDNYFVALSSLAPGELQSLTGTLAWTATSPATASLQVLLLVDEGDNGWWYHEGQPAEFGAGPLSLEWDLTSYTDHALALWISDYTGAGAGGAWVGGQVNQAFVFDGQLTSVDLVVSEEA